MVNTEALYLSWKRSYKPSQIILKRPSLMRLENWFKQECQNREVGMSLIDLEALLDHTLTYQENKQTLLDELEKIAPVATSGYDAEIFRLEEEIKEKNRKIEHLEGKVQSKQAYLKHSRILIKVFTTPYFRFHQPGYRGYCDCFLQHLKTGYPDLYVLHTQKMNVQKKLENLEKSASVLGSHNREITQNMCFGVVLENKFDKKVNHLKLNVEYGVPLRGECDICKGEQT